MQRINNSTDNGIEYKTARPGLNLSGFVENFWMIKNSSGRPHEIVVLPDGRFDIIFSCLPNKAISIIQTGLETAPKYGLIPAKMVMFAVSFKLPAIEYLLQTKLASMLNGAEQLPKEFWGITTKDLDTFEVFCEKVSAIIAALIKPGIDGRKQALFDLIYASNGSLPVKELSKKVFWSSRQINRYFKEQFGISLKTYCNIVRFKTSLHHIKNGQLFPEQNFADQTHFIKQVKKFSGVVPKELFKNKNDRFILLSALEGK